MKKIFLYILVGTLALSSCKKDDEIETYKEPENIAVQNDYDDQAIQKFMTDHYFDTQGNIKPFSVTDTIDDNYTKLKDTPGLEKLNSGVIVIPIQNAQPINGTNIEDKDVLNILMKSQAYVANQTAGVVSFEGGLTFVDNVNNSSMTLDPIFYYVKNSVLNAATTDAAKQRSYYEIEGFQEGIKKFKAFNLSNSAPYKMQGAIIVPSRAAYARDASYYNSSTNSVRNRSFVFNFQVYKATTRDMNTED